MKSQKVFVGVFLIGLLGAMGFSQYRQHAYKKEIDAIHRQMGEQLRCKSKEFENLSPAERHQKMQAEKYRLLTDVQRRQQELRERYGQ